MLRINPASYGAFKTRGDVYKTKGALDRAIADYDAAIRLNPTFASAFHARGVAYRMKGDRDRAVADFREAIRLLPYVSADSRAELKALGAPEPPADSARLPPAKNLLDSLK
jgi:tetratricopeptide (TPR) repeat protein